MIEAENLAAGYGKIQILHGVSFTARAGEITAIIGGNGCGKSTLLKSVTGLLPIAGGEIRLNGRSLADLTATQRARQAAYLPQSRNVPDITAGRLVLHGRFPYLSYPRKYKKEDHFIARSAMARMGIADLSHRLMAELSGGTRQKAYLAMALAQCAPVIILDEPTSYLDIGQQFRLMEILRDLAHEGKTILLVLHDLLAALKFSDSICVMDSGRILMQDTPGKVLDSGLIRKLYGVEVRTAPTPDGPQYYYFPVL